MADRVVLIINFIFILIGNEMKDEGQRVLFVYGQMIVVEGDIP